ncbi:MAG: methyltransferase domain-containing protein [Methanosarcinales archaeon]|nr:methyltransferase domain-containing protein [Methanosarcinales archaeon]
MTEQIKEWAGKFGEEYTDRNTVNLVELDESIHNNIGVSRTEQINEFLSGLELNNILEVGSNVGNQLLLLQKNGFKNLNGIEINWYAVEKAKERTKEINIIQGSAFDIPFKDAYFDLIFTSGVLIHISPQDINRVLDEIYRCSKKYIWGSEYFATEYTQVDYRGHDELLWKTNFAELYLDRFPNLQLVKEKKYSYLEDEKLVDQVFLLKKE